MNKILLILAFIILSCSSINHRIISCEKKYDKMTSNDSEIYIKDYGMKVYGKIPISFIQIYPNSTITLIDFVVYFNKKGIYDIRKYKRMIPKSSINYDNKGNLLFNNKYFLDKYFNENTINGSDVLKKISTDFWKMSNAKRLDLLNCYDASK